MIVPLHRPRTADEFEAAPHVDGYELVDGELKEKSLGFEAGYIQRRLATALGQFVDAAGLGWVADSETGYVLRPKTVRKPDVSFVARGRFPDNRLPRGWPRLAPDLAAEVVSPGDLCEDLEAKLADYLAAGVPLVWVIYPLTRTAYEVRADGPADGRRRAGRRPGRARVPAADRRPAAAAGRRAPRNLTSGGDAMSVSRAARPRRVDPDDIPDGFELVDGELVEKGMGVQSSWIGGELYAALREYCRAHRAGWAFCATAGFDCFPGKKRTVRYPDVAVVRYDRLPDGLPPTGHIGVPPDLAAEVVSPKDRVADLDRKLAAYLAVGVPLVWVISPDTRTARVHRPDFTLTHVGEDGRLDGEGVLPGFSVRLADLFPVAPPPAA